MQPYDGEAAIYIGSLVLMLLFSARLPDATRTSAIGAGS
jgi:hypothetical protein